MKKNYFNEEETKEKILRYQSIVETELNKKGKPIVINKTTEVIRLENEITKEVLKIVKAIIFFYSYTLWEPYEDLLSVGIDACAGCYLKFDPKNGTAFNYFSIISKKCLYGYTIRRKNKRNIETSIDEKIDIKSPQYSNNIMFFVEGFESTVNDIIDENFTRKKRKKYKNVLDVLCDYLYKTKMYISKTDLYKFSSIYGIRSIDIRSFVKDVKKFLPEMKELIDFQDSDVYRFDNLEINSGVSKVKQ